MGTPTFDLRRCHNHIYKNGKAQMESCLVCFGTGLEMTGVLDALNLLREIQSLIEKKKPKHPLKTRIKKALKSLNYGDS